MDHIPEILAQCSFFLSGLFLGNAIYMYHFMSINLLSAVSYFPFVVAIGAAFCTAGGLFSLKTIYRRELFIQFYLLIVATILFLISGFLYINETGHAAILLSAVSHGIIYIASLSYVHVRISPRFRSFRIALCHVWYLFGCAVSGHMLSIWSVWINDTTTMYDQISITIISSSGVMLILLLLNEILNRARVYDYKKSLDAEVNEENHAKQLVSSTQQQIINYYGSQNRSTNVKKVKVFDVTTFILLFLKTKGIVLFSAVFLVYARTSAYEYTEGNMLMSMLYQWLAFVGAFVGAIFCLFLSAKNQHYIFAILQVLAMVASIAVFDQPNGIEKLTWPLWMMAIFLGASYSIADIAIMDTASIKNIEISLVIGYIVEIFPIAIIQYCLYYAMDSIVIGTDIVASFRYHMIVFVIVIMLHILFCTIAYSNTFGKSIIEMRNKMYGVDVAAATITNSDTENSNIRNNGSVKVVEIIPKPKKIKYQSTRSRPAETILARTAGEPINNPYFAQGLYRPFERPHQSNNASTMMTPGYVIPRAVIGGAIFGSMATNM